MRGNMHTAKLEVSIRVDLIEENRLSGRHVSYCTFHCIQSKQVKNIDTSLAFPVTLD
jgi:hypothetical protein